MQKLAEEGLSDLIIIAIDHGEQERIIEYLPYYHLRFGKGKGIGKGGLYIRFMVEGLIPYITCVHLKQIENQLICI